jgi:hypothetical protein
VKLPLGRFFTGPELNDISRDIQSTLRLQACGPKQHDDDDGCACAQCSIISETTMPPIRTIDGMKTSCNCGLISQTSVLY